MLKNFITISFRNLIRQKGFSLINIIGLTMGLTVGFLIILYIFDELNYDKFHHDSDRLYRIAIKGKMGDMPLNIAVTPGAMGRSLYKDMPEVETYTTFEHISGNQLFRTGDNKFYDQDLFYADTNFFKIFNYNMLYGDPVEALKHPYSIVLTKRIAEKYFGNINPVGEILKLNNQHDYTVTGVVEDIGDRSHLQANMLASFQTRIQQSNNRVEEDWGDMMYYTYLKLNKDINIFHFESKITEYVNQELSRQMESPDITIQPYLQPVTNIHLKSNILGEIEANSDISYIYILSAIAFGILFIAGINFMNLSTARSANRAKEVSIKKVLGSSKRQLIIQFLGESVFLSIMAFILSLTLIELLLPVFNNITNKEITIDFYTNIPLLLFFAFISIILGIFSGSYPAFYLSALQPVKILNSKLRSGTGNKKFRNILVFLQFLISAGLIISTIVIFNQLNFIRSKRLGFNKDNVISIFLRNEEVQRNADLIKESISSLARVEATSLASSIPGMSLNGSSYYPEGKANEPWLIYNFDVDEDFIETTFKMEITEGRNFSYEFPSDSNAIIINEELKNSFGWEDPIGRTINSVSPDSGSKEFHIIGVVRDFHFKSLHSEIEPTMIHFKRDLPSFLLVRIDPASMDRTIQQIGNVWDELNPELPFDYQFVDESFESLYASERKLGILLLYLTIFAIFIASLGLLGLASYTAEQRTKEIGIRKVLGASIYSISRMLSIEYLRLIGIANLIAWPVSYKLMEIWLRNFSYKSDMPIWAFVLAGILTLLPALIVINLQTIKVASTNPAQTLKYE